MNARQLNAENHHPETINDASTKPKSNSDKHQVVANEEPKPGVRTTRRTPISTIQKVFSKLMVRSQPNETKNKPVESRTEIPTSDNDPQKELGSYHLATPLANREKEWKLDPPTKGPPSKITPEVVVKDNKSETWDQVLEDFFKEKWLKHFGLSPRQIVRETVPLKLDPKASPPPNLNYEPLKEVKNIKTIEHW